MQVPDFSQPGPESRLPEEKPAAPKDRKQLPRPIPPREEKVRAVEKELKGKIRKEPADKPALQKLSKELSQAAEKKKLAAIHREQAKATAAARGAPPTAHVKMEKVAQSQNPITKIDAPLYISRQTIQRLLTQQLDITNANLHKAYSEVVRQENQPRARTRLIAVGGEIFEKYLQEKSGTPEEKVGRMVESLKQVLNEEIDSLKFHNLSEDEALAELNHWTSAIAALEQFILPPSLANVPVQYKKEELLSNLRVQLANLPANVNPDSLLQAIQDINRHPDPYIDRTLVAEYPAIDLKEIEKNLTEYVSSSDLLVQNPSAPSLKKALESFSSFAAKFADFPGFAFKVGLENSRELLAGQLLDRLGLDRYVVAKSELTLPQAQLSGIKAPKGIAGKWLEGSREFPMKEWNLLMRLKQKTAASRFLNTPVDEAALKAAEQKVLDQGGHKSIQAHALIDALFCSYDSHPDQYRQMANGEFFNFDFARFFAPSSTVIDSNYTYATLRSAFLDHPALALPMDNQLIATINSWDIDQIGQDFKAAGLLADAVFYQKAQDRLAELYADRASAAKVERPALEGLCKKYGVDSQLEEPVLRKKLQATLNDLEAEQISECFSKIHPQAFVEFQERMRRLQEYASSTTTPNAAEAFARMYPEFTLFLRVLERLEPNPGSSIGVGNDMLKRGMAFRSLESIAAEAEKHQLASPDELQLMRQTIERLRAKSQPKELIGLTMNVAIK